MWEKSNTKICTRNNNKKKQHYFGWSWKSLIQATYITGHEWDSMTHVQVCRLCQLCQCLSSVLLTVKILRKNDKASQVKCQMSSKTILISLSIFRCGGGKIQSMEDLPRRSLHTTVDHKTLKILRRGVNLCQRDDASMIALEGVE